MALGQLLMMPVMLLHVFLLVALSWHLFAPANWSYSLIFRPTPLSSRRRHLLTRCAPAAAFHLPTVSMRCPVSSARASSPTCRPPPWMRSLVQAIGRQQRHRRGARAAPSVSPAPTATLLCPRACSGRVWCARVEEVTNQSRAECVLCIRWETALHQTSKKGAQAEATRSRSEVISHQHKRDPRAEIYALRRLYRRENRRTTFHTPHTPPRPRPAPPRPAPKTHTPHATSDTRRGL